MQWNPYMMYTWTKQEIKAWFLKNGPWAFYDGYMWTLKTKKLCPGVYQVTSVKYY